MKLNAEQVIQGLINYADNEVLNKLPASGRWIMGTGIALATNRANAVVEILRENAIAKMLGVVDDDGMIDADLLIEAMKSAADRYGSMTVDVPLIGKLTFSSSDVNQLSAYMM